MQLPYVVFGKGLALRPIGRADLQTLYQWRSDLPAFGLLPSTKHTTTYEEFEHEMASILRRSVGLVVVTDLDGEPSSSGQPMGLVLAYDIHPIEGRCSMLIYMVPQYRRHAFGIKAAFLFWDYLFRSFPFRKIYVDAAGFNRGWLDSTSSTESGLLVEEACLRQHELLEGKYWDATRLALYRQRWMERRDLLLLLIDIADVRDPLQAVEVGLESSGDELQARNAQTKDDSRARKGGLPSSSSEVLRLFITYPQTGGLDEVTAMLADDLVFESPAAGMAGGKEELVRLMRRRLSVARRQTSGADAGDVIVWSDPEEEGDTVRMVGSCGSGGTLEMTMTFNSDGKVARYCSQGPAELMAKYYLGMNQVPP